MRKIEKPKKLSASKIHTFYRDLSAEYDTPPISNPSKALLAALGAVENMGKIKK